MGRSQRHKVIIQGTDSTGKGLSEKQPSFRYINQFANSQAFSVSTGPAGGPLQGSSMAGFPPTLIPLPSLDAQRSAELQEGSGDFSAPGQFNLSGNPVYTSLPPENTGGEPEPETPVTLTSLSPNTAVLGDPDFTLSCIGTGFSEATIINFANQDEPTTFVSDTEVTTGVKPSLGWGPNQPLPVFVYDNGNASQMLDFTFTEPVAPEGEAATVKRSRRKATE